MENITRKISYKFLLIFIVTLHCAISASGAPENVVEVHVGKNVVLPCVYSHQRTESIPSVIEWMRDGNGLPVFIKIGKYSPHIDPSYGGRLFVQSNGANLTIERVQAEDEGWYECRVYFLGGESNRRMIAEGEDNAPFINGTWVKLVVTDPPVFRATPPTELTRREGETLMLRCRATGRPTPVISWLKNGYPIRNGPDGVRISDGELVISPLKKSHNGTYSCNAQNKEGFIAASTRVFIQAAPELVRGPQNTTVREGHKVIFSCKAEGYPTDIKYDWFYKGKSLAVASEIRGRSRAMNDGTFEISDVQASDAGAISCRARNGFGIPPMANATLTVQFPARVRSMPRIIYGGLELSLTMVCRADAVPPVSFVQWRKNGKIIKESKHISVRGNMSLIIHQVKESDAARYTCTPYNKLGTQGKSTESELIVRYPPSFTVKPKSEYNTWLGKRLDMSCDGSGDPPPTISWKKLDETGREVDMTWDPERIKVSGGNISIEPVMKIDHGRWRCLLSSAVAVVKSEVMVFVRFTTPHNVTNVTVVTSQRNARISWNPGFNGGNAQHFFVWYKRADVGQNMWMTKQVERHRSVTTVGNLEPGAMYKFSVMPENVIGNGYFSKEVFAKTKVLENPLPPEPNPTIQPPSHLDHRVNEDELMVIMWQPPLDAVPEEMLGYMIEFRRLLEENEDSGEDIVSFPAVTSTFSPSDSSYANPMRSKRTAKSWNELVRERIRRDSSTTTQSSDQDKLRWSSWDTLSAVDANKTEYIIPKDKLFRDEIYQIHILAVTEAVYSSPSAIITVSTKDMNEYPFFVAYEKASSMTAAVIAGIVIVACIVVAISCAFIWCCKKRRKKALAGSPYRFGSLHEDKLRRGSRSSESTSPDEEGVGSSKKNGKKRSIVKLKKKMLKADVQMGEAHASTDELVGLGRNVSFSGKQQNEVQTDNSGAPVVRKINRTSDGKFVVTEQLQDVEACRLLPDDKTERSTKSKESNRSYDSRPHSTDWDSRMPLPQENTQPVDESLEIDCSQSNIEVRYVKDGRGKGCVNSSSMSSLSGPRKYNLAMRQVGPCDYSMDSSMGDASTPEFRHSQINVRHSVVSTGSQMRGYGQYVNMRGDTSPRKSTRNREHRISSPPGFPDYHATQHGSPTKFRYHKHPEQPASHQPSSRDSFSAHTEGLLYDPRYTRIEPIYEVGPYRTHNGPNRHSSFVIDTRRELPNHRHPHRAIQICSRTTAVPSKAVDTTSYPTPMWRNQGGQNYHTLPYKKHRDSAHDSNETYYDHENVEQSLRRHNENAVSPRRKEASSSTLNTNSLGRSRKKSGDSPRRRRVQSMDDLSRDSPQTDEATIVATGSMELLSYHGEDMPSAFRDETQHDLTLKADNDRAMDGSDAGDEASDITVLSSHDASRLPIATMTSQHNDIRMLPSKPRGTKVVVTSPRDDDSSAVSSLVNPPHQNEIVSSGYDSHNTSRVSSNSPASLLPFCSQPNATMRASFHDHDRTSTASSSDRSRKDTSSVDEKYEWDSEIAMESEILELLRQFGSHNRTGSMSQALVEEIRKFGVDKVQQMNKDELADFENAVKNRDRSSSEDSDRSTTIDTSDMYNKESMERRCAALREEYKRHQMGLLQSSNPMGNEPIFSSTSANA